MAKTGALGQAALSILQPVQANRYFDNVEHLLDSIAQLIMERELTDFGSFLKGNDYTNTNMIANSDLF